MRRLRHGSERDGKKVRARKAEWKGATGLEQATRFYRLLITSHRLSQRDAVRRRVHRASRGLVCLPLLRSLL